jgi:dolichyl-phosphate-mannose-protein mannosyltransferase
VLVALALLVWTAALVATGGFSITVFGVRAASRSPVRPLAAAFGLFAIGYGVFGPRRMEDEIIAVMRRAGSAAAPSAGIAAIAVAIAGVRWGTFTASGVDAYGYVSQAALLQRGVLRVEQPFVADIAWPDVDAAFAPMGYRPSPAGHAIVPTYAIGLPALMAVAEATAGACGPYSVVPLFGAMCVWCCYLLGRRISSPAAGACAAVLLACSPAFLFHLLAPMSDVPAAALWTAALLCSFGTGRRAAISAGVCAALAILVRPNLVPLAAVIGIAFVRPAGSPARKDWKSAAWFAVAVVLAAAAVATINTKLYGSPLRSGYNDLDAAYSAAHSVINAQRYGRWLLDSQSWLIVGAGIALLAPFFARSSPLSARTSLIFIGIVATVAVSYLPYAVFDDWRYLRFFLPAYPPLMIGLSASVLWLLRRVAPVVGVVAFIAIGTYLVSHELRFAAKEGVARLGEVERRYVAVARFVEAQTPPTAVMIALQHAGSVRHYSGRLTVRFDQLSIGLDEALASLHRVGRRPFILLEDWEEPQFKRQFGASSEAGRLAWRPYARLDAPGGVNIYDPEQMHTIHDAMAIPQTERCDCAHH